MTAICANPVCVMPRSARYRRCHGCLIYWWRHHTERPAYLARGEWLQCGMLACEQRVHARGLCVRHYNRWRDHPTRYAPRPCGNPVCPQFAHPRHGRRCGACAIYHWRHGTERPIHRTQGLVRLCGAVGCDRPALTRGHCKRHYIALWRAERRAAS